MKKLTKRQQAAQILAYNDLNHCNPRIDAFMQDSLQTKDNMKTIRDKAKVKTADFMKFIKIIEKEIQISSRALKSLMKYIIVYWLTLIVVTGMVYFL